MSEVTVSSPEGDIIDMEISQEEVSNCYALSMDKRIDEIIDLISDIHELLGLNSDKAERIERVNCFRRKAMEMNIDPSLDPSFTIRVEQYCQLLRQKKQTLQSIFDCCDDFYMQMRRELDALNGRFSTDSKARATFVCNYSNKCGSKPFVPNETTLLLKKQRRNRLPSAALEILWNFLREHRDNPYPTSQEKEWLAQQTNLSVTQIRNWFTNTRKRKLIQSQESDEDYLTDSDFSDSFHDSQTSSDSQPHKRRGRKKSSSTRSRGPLELVQNQSTITMNDGTLSKVTKNQDGTWIQFLSTFDHASVLNHGSDGDSEGAHQQQQEFSIPDFDNYTEYYAGFDWQPVNRNNTEIPEGGMSVPLNDASGGIVLPENTIIQKNRFIAIYAVSVQNDIDNVSEESIRDFAARTVRVIDTPDTDISVSENTAALNVSVTQPGIRVIFLTPDEIMQKLGFSQFEKDWANLMYNTLEQGGF